MARTDRLDRTSVRAAGAAAAFLFTSGPRAALVGASGSVFGLLVVSVASKVNAFSFRRLVELLAIAPFVYSQLMSNLSAQVSGVAGNVSYIGHLGGAATGLVLVTILSLLPAEK
jgi:membrane associated rhomboid family serine protease